MVDAAAVVLWRDAGAGIELFIAQRSPKLRFLGGWFAFPGGVVDDADRAGSGDDDRTMRACAVRELHEELGVVASIGPIFEVIAHRYPEFDLLMLVYSCTFDREPVAKEVAQVRWVDPADLPNFPILPADAPLVARLAAAG